MDWYKCSQTFIKIVETNSFSKASEVLHTSPSVVSKRIQQLEDRLNTPLITRSTRSFRLTEAGSQYYKRMLPLLSEWNEIKVDISKKNPTPSGTFRVAMPTMAGNYYIENLFTKFSNLYPEIKLELVLGTTMSNLQEKHIDVNISTTDVSKEGNFVYKKLQGPIKRLYASPAYLRKHGEPKSLIELKKHNCITHINHKKNVWDFHQSNIKVSGNLICNNLASLLKAAESGNGICLISDALVQEELRNNKIQHILQDYYSEPIDLYLSFPAFIKLPINAKVFIQFLEKELSFSTRQPVMVNSPPQAM